MKKQSFKKLNITFLDFDDIKNPLLAAGQAKATLEVGKRLAEKGHKVNVICSRYPGYQDRLENGIFYKHIGLGSSNIRLNNLVYFFALPFQVRKIKGDIILECFTAPISTLFSPLFTNIPVVALPTSFEADRFAELYHFPFDIIERFGLRFYKYFLPYTKGLDKKMRDANPKVISKIVSQGVGTEFYKIKMRKPEYILYLGRIDIGQKGLDLLLKSYNKIRNTIKYPLVIAGFGPDEAKLKALIKKLNLEQSVSIIGPTYGDKKAKVLSKALFVAFPSRHEGFSLFSLEALASSLPLVGFDIPGLSFAGKQVSFKAKPFDVNDYSKMLVKATNLKTISQMRLNAKAFSKQYSWEKVTDQFEDFFQYIVSKKDQS